MRIMIASDLHGSAYYTEKLLEAYEREGAERLLLLGDLLYHGPRNDYPEKYDTREVFRMLNERKQDILAVRGNCDSEVDQMVLEFPMMADYAILYAGKRMIFATHGHLYNMENPPLLNPGDILLHGHTHTACRVPFGNENVYCNPGSISMPKENTPHGYMILTDDGLEWKKVDGEVYDRMEF